MNRRDDDPPPGPVAPGVEELRKRALALGFAFVVLSVTGLLVAIYWQLATPILWAVTLAVLFYPVQRRLAGWLHSERAGAVATTILGLAIVFIPSIFLVVSLVGEARGLWPTLRDFLSPEAFERVAAWIDRSPLRGVVYVLLEGDPAGGAIALQARLQEGAEAVQAFLLGQMKSVTRNVPVAFVQMGVPSFAFYFFLVNGTGWVRSLQRALPLDADLSARLFGIAGRTIAVVFRGVLLTAAAQAVAAGLGFWVAGAPVPVLLSVLTFVASMIPVFGSAGIWVPVAVGLFLSGRPGAGIGLAIYGTFFVSLLDNVLRPFLIGREMKLPLLWLFLAILGGLKLFGFVGIVLGPMALALAMALYRIYQEGIREPLVRGDSFRLLRREPDDPV